MRFHPKCILPASEYPSLTLDVSELSLEADLCRTCAVFSSNLTSAALDAFLFGSRIAVFKATDTLNYSPLLGAVDVEFVSTADDLAHFLSTASPDFVARNRVASGSLEKWRELIQKNFINDCSEGRQTASAMASSESASPDPQVIL